MISLEQTLPKVIFFDAVGTLFGVKGSVGKIYQQLASQHGVVVSAEDLDRAFGYAFINSPTLAFETTNSIPQQEYQWWYHH